MAGVSISDDTWQRQERTTKIPARALSRRPALPVGAFAVFSQTNFGNALARTICTLATRHHALLRRYPPSIMLTLMKVFTYCE